jgi:hypothetical protein
VIVYWQLAQSYTVLHDDPVTMQLTVELPFEYQVNKHSRFLPSSGSKASMEYEFLALIDRINAKAQSTRIFFIGKVYLVSIKICVKVFVLQSNVNILKLAGLEIKGHFINGDICRCGNGRDPNYQFKRNLKCFVTFTVTPNFGTNLPTPIVCELSEQSAL